MKLSETSGVLNIFNTYISKKNLSWHLFSRFLRQSNFSRLLKSKLRGHIFCEYFTRWFIMRNKIIWRKWKVALLGIFSRFQNCYLSFFNQIFLDTQFAFCVNEFLKRYLYWKLSGCVTSTLRYLLKEPQWLKHSVASIQCVLLML